MSEVGVFSFLLLAKKEFMDFPVARAESTRSSHATLTRSLGQLVFCVDNGRCTWGTLVDKKRIIPDREKRSDGGCFLFLPAAPSVPGWWGSWSCNQLTGLPSSLQRNQPDQKRSSHEWTYLGNILHSSVPGAFSSNSKPVSLFCFVRGS